MITYYKKWCLLVVLFIIWTYSNAFLISANDSTGLPGDNFSLDGALELFKKSGSPEEFEKLLNSEDSKVNNLDLNEDGEIDYIKVIDKQEGDVHTFILQAAISDTENQDIAVIDLQRTSDGNAVAQIVGDEDIYGNQRIVEPTEQVKTNAGATTTHITVNVWAWPMVRYVYSPAYVVWVSPWTWYVRPVWWRPWRPVRYGVFYPYALPYRPYYRVVPVRRVFVSPRMYRPYRTTSMMVINKNRPTIIHYRETRRAAPVYHGPRINRRMVAPAPNRNPGGPAHRGGGRMNQGGGGYNGRGNSGRR